MAIKCEQCGSHEVVTALCEEHSDELMWELEQQHELIEDLQSCLEQWLEAAMQTENTPGQQITLTVSQDVYLDTLELLGG